MAIKRLNYFGKLFIDEKGNALIETQNGNKFIIDNISDLTTIEAKDLLLGSSIGEEEEEEDNYNIKQKIVAKKMINKWNYAVDKNINKGLI